MERIRYQASGPVLIRASTDPGDLGPEPRPDLIGAGTAREGLAWLGDQWAPPEVREAISMASLSLAARVRQLLAPDACGVPAAVVGRAVRATFSYLRRWQRRTTPFGLFAAVTTATVGPTAAKVETRHRAVARADGDWLTLIVDGLESRHDLRRRLSVVADSARFGRDGRVIVAARPQPGQRSPDLPRESSTRDTPAVRLALAYANQPIRFDQLVTRIADEAPHVAGATIEAMLHGLIDAGLLITGLRPPMTAVDGLAHVIEALDTAGAADLPSMAPVLDQLRGVHEQLVRHNTLADPVEAAQIRAAVTVPMTELVPDAEHQLAVDMRLDAQISVPPPVLDEVALAVEVLLRVSTQPFDWTTAETAFAARIAARFDQLDGGRARWWFLRKHPCWRIRIRTTDHDPARALLDELTAAGVIAAWTPGIYEPETAAFGGDPAMTIVHELFCADSRSVLDYATADPPPLGRRELSLLLIRALQHHAGLDWFEAADVFDQVAQMRPAPPAADTGRVDGLATQVRPLLALPADARTALFAPGGSLTDISGWLAAFTKAGEKLAKTDDDGSLHRGIRAVLAQIVIFHWNRLDLPARTQGVLARAAATAILPRN